jgi:hypothetical protein
MHCLDPKNKLLVPKKNVLCFFEKLARGRYTERPNIVSATFAIELWAYLESMNLVEKEHLVMTSVKEAFENFSLDLHLFSQLLKPGCNYTVPP